MPLSPSKVSALRKMADYAGGNEQAGKKLERILDVVREELGVNAISVVASQASPGDVLLWHSAKDSFKLDASLLKQAVLSPQLDQDCNDLHIFPLPPTNGYRAVMVADGDFNNDKNSALLEVAASYISILIHNSLLSSELDVSKANTRKRIEEIAAIYEVGKSVDAAHIRRTLDTIVVKAAAVMDAQTCSLMLVDHRDQALVIEASHGLKDDIVKGTRIRFGEGIAGIVAQTGEPMLITDVASDPRVMNNVKPRMGVSGSMCVPLRDENSNVCGVLSIRRHDPNPPFTQDDLQLFSVFAQHAALALSNAQLYSQLHRKVAELSRISEVLHAINSTLDLDYVLNQIVESITEVVGFDRCCVYLQDLRSGDFVAGARKGYGPGDHIIDRVKPDNGVIGLVAREQIPVFSQDDPLEGNNSGPGDFLVAPIVVRELTIGVVTVDNSRQQSTITPEDVELLTTFVSQAGIAVENARLYEAMEEKYAELNILYEHSRNISTAYGLDKTAEILVQTTSKAVHCDGAGLLLLDPKRGHLKLQASIGKMSANAAVIGDIAQTKRAVDFVRELRTPAIISANSSERKGGANADFLNTLAPNGASLMLAPLVAEDSAIGLLAIYRNAPNDFQGAEFKLVSIITSHAATILKNAVNYEQKMRQRVLELTALYEFSKKISSAANLEEALDSILAIVADVVDYDDSFIYEIDQENGLASVKVARFRGEREELPPDEPLDGASVMSWAIRERKALISPDVTLDPRFVDPNTGMPHVRSLMSIPLIVQDEVVGLLSVHSHSPNRYSDDDVRVLSIIASQGAAIYKELEALSALTSYTDNILSSIAAGVATLDSNGIVLTWNTAAEKIVGIGVSQIVGLPYERVLELMRLSDSDKENLMHAVKHVFNTGDTHHSYKLSFHPRNRDEVFMNLSISQLLNSTGDQLGLVVIFEDITREIQMEDEFRRMGELAAVGQLAASIAHELRNPLSSIKGAAQFLSKEFSHEASIVEFLGIIIEEVNGLNKLTTEFLDFARPMQLELKPTSVNTVVEKTLQLMSVHITDNNIAVKETFHPDVPSIQADEAQLDQVLKNIIINALQAMPHGGALAIETGPTPAGGAYISISDTGIGIPPEKTERIFQPFFTTKTKGTGLGLSVVHKIVENHGGRIELTSEVDKGSTFKIILPRTGVHSSIGRDLDSIMERRISGKFNKRD
ncbi:MAG: GAF domain-containing protein [Armatimonadetes bacterium]|nr:GAF domain-containing protein [Armatimonadota bacterium]